MSRVKYCQFIIAVVPEIITGKGMLERREIVVIIKKM